MSLLYKRLSDTAIAPSKGSKFAAGWDLFADEAVDIWGGHGFVKVNTNIAVAIPEGYYGRIAPRSGNTSKQHLDVGAGVVDSDFRGPISVMLMCTKNEHWAVITKGMAIAQLIIEKINTDLFEEADELPVSERDQKAFGSSGNNV